MRDHTDCSHFYPTKCNFPKKSLDTSIPQIFPQTLLQMQMKQQSSEHNIQNKKYCKQKKILHVLPSS